MSWIQAEASVRARYSAAATAVEPQLCCPIEYDPQYLSAIPNEVLEKDYGCGDPSQYLRRGETVLDLGSGTGKICFIASQVVGPEGRIIGIDMTEAMLAVARRNAPFVAERIGYANVEFRKGLIQDLALDLELLDAELKHHSIGSSAALLDVQSRINKLKFDSPLIASDVIDVVVSNCVLNLVEPNAKKQLFAEIYRVLKRGGRAVISDIVSDESVPLRLQQDPALWSGCISGALREDEFLQAFEVAGFHGITLLKRDINPWRTVQGIEFRSVTVAAYKGKKGSCRERNQAVIYKGPFKVVLDDDGHRFQRGLRYAVCDKTYQLYQLPPYTSSFECIEPRVPIPLSESQPFDCSRAALRSPKEMKGDQSDLTTEASDCCNTGGCGE